MRRLIQGGTIVNEGRSFIGSLVIEDDCVIEIIEGNEVPRGMFDEIVNATGCFVLPGVIDDHVHFREPGLQRRQILKVRVVQLRMVVSHHTLRCQTPIHKR